MSRLRPTRDLLSRILLAVGCVMVLVALLATWVRAQALDTNRWVDTSSAILADPHVQAATASYLADQISSSPGVTDAIRGALPPKLAPIAGAATGLLGEAAQKAAQRALASGVFQESWRRSQRITHRQLVALINGRTIAGRAVILDLRPMLGLLAERVGLGPKAVAGLPRDRGRFVVMTQDQVDQVQRAGRLLRSATWWASVLSLALLAGAVATARDRRRALLAAGVGLVITSLLLLAVQRVGIAVTITALTKDGPGAEAGRATLHIATALLAHLAWTVATLGGLLAFGAWAVGPAGWAVGLRTRVTPLLRRHRGPAHAINAVLVLVLVAFALLPWSANFLADLLYLGAGALLIEAVRRGPAPGPAGTPLPAT